MARVLLPAIAALIVTVHPVEARDPSIPEDTLSISPGFLQLIHKVPDIVGMPVEDEHPGDVEDSTVVRTTTGLLYWQPEGVPAWTDAQSNRVALDPTVEQPIKWSGADLFPPPTLRRLLSLPVLQVSSGYDARVACIEAKESGGANVANAHGSGAVGVMQFMPSTFYAHAAEMGHSEWSPWNPSEARAVATHDLAMGRRTQWTVSGC